MLDSDWFGQTYGINADPWQLVNGLGQQNVMDEISIKPFCSARQVMPSVYGLRKIVERGISPDEMTEVRLFVPSEFVKMIDHGASDRLSSLTSAPYQLALAAYYPEGLYDIVRSEILKKDTMLTFMNRVRVYGDEQLSKEYPKKWPARVEAVTAAGTLKEHIEAIPGDPRNRFCQKEILEKSRKFLRTVLGDKETEDVMGFLGADLCHMPAIIDLIGKMNSIVFQE